MFNNIKTKSKASFKRRKFDKQILKIDLKVFKVYSLQKLGSIYLFTCSSGAHHFLRCRRLLKSVWQCGSVWSQAPYISSLGSCFKYANRAYPPAKLQHCVLQEDLEGSFPFRGEYRGVVSCLLAIDTFHQHEFSARIKKKSNIFKLTSSFFLTLTL